MPTIGWFEILIIVIVAIVILGPKDFPVMLKKVGSWIGTAKKYISNMQNEVSNIDIDENDGGFISHLTELRKRLINSFIFLIIFFIACYFFAEHL
jgi:sec-independent protein translocase protein TatB